MLVSSLITCPKRFSLEIVGLSMSTIFCLCLVSVPIPRVNEKLFQQNDLPLLLHRFCHSIWLPCIDLLQLAPNDGVVRWGHFWQRGDKSTSLR